MALLLGVVADNHRLVDPALPRVLAGVDEIVHAGDLVTPDILDALAAIAPVHAVRGNNDVAGAVAALAEELVLERDGVRLLVRHIVGTPARLDRAARASIAKHSPRAVIMGHSHRPLAVEHAGVVLLNPGSCGPRRFSLPRTAGVLHVSEASLRFVVVDLDGGAIVLDEAFAKRAGS